MKRRESFEGKKMNLLSQSSDLLVLGKQIQGRSSSSIYNLSSLVTKCLQLTVSSWMHNVLYE